MAPNAVVILARLCYASGNSEWGAANPTKSTAIKRVDNYGAGFLRAGAKAVFAEGITDVRYIIKNLYTSNRNMREIFFNSPHRTMTYRFHFVSKRTSWAIASMDPYKPSRYYRSVDRETVGDGRPVARLLTLRSLANTKKPGHWPGFSFGREVRRAGR